MSSKDSKYDETCRVILSLLLARKGATSVPVLNQDYYDIEGEYIPYHRFGYADLVAFFRSIPQYFKVERYGGRYYVRGIASEKSKHVSSLVARQKQNPKMNSPNRQLYQVNRYTPHMQRQCNRIPTEKMHFLVQYIKNYPDGLSIQNVMTILQKQLPLVMLTVNQVRRQLHELSHQLTMDGEMIYPVSSNNVPQESKVQKSPILVPQTRSAYHQAEVARAAEDKNCVEEYDSDQNDYLSDGCESNDYLIRRSTNKRLATNFVQNINHKQTFESNDYKNSKGIDDCFTTSNCSNNINNKDGVPSNGYTDISTLISDRTRLRLEQLLQKYPEGIWCAELPDKYLSEYKVHLNYTKLGFSSVREYVSYLPNIFYMTCVNASDDFMLFSANKKPTILNQEVYENQTTEFLGTKCNDDATIPGGISNITNKFISDDVMNYDDKLDFISVTDLQCRKNIEIYIAEVFTPSFFWIHLRENMRSFYSLMDNLQYFYEKNRESYTIPKIALSKGLNCVCLFSYRWHRAIIKSVKRDFKVTVMFYDYGTLKTYPSEEVYYLHKQFSYLPAQAIPCSLYNIKPCINDRWKRSVTEQFIDKTSDNLLVANIISIDCTHNSMMVVLTDASEEEGVNINDWLINQNLARQGKLGNTVDMASLMKYVLNNINQLPMYCYAEENLIVNYYFKTSTEQMPLISPEQTLYCNNQQEELLKPPPGFLPLNSSDILKNVSSFGKTEITTNPFLDNELPDIISIDIAKQVFAQIWKENTQLQIKLSKIIYDLLQCLSIKKSIFQNYIIKQYQINSILKDIEKLISSAADVSVVDRSTPNSVNEMTLLNDHSNDEFTALNTSLNLFDDDRSTNQTSLLNSVHRSLNDFPFKNDKNQSIDEFSSHIQVPSQSSINCKSVLDNYEVGTSLSFQETDHENTNKPSMDSVSPLNIDNSSSNNSNNNDSSSSSSFFNLKTDICNICNVRKETNPFKRSTTKEIQISEQKANNCKENNPTSADLFAINLRNDTSKMESVNIYSKTDTFFPAAYPSDINGNNYSSTIYKTNPIICDTQKRKTNADTNATPTQNTCKNHDNIQMISSALEQYDKELLSQLTNEMTTLSLKYGNNTYIDEGYITQPSTTHSLQNLSPIVTNKLKCHQEDINTNLSNVSTQSWKKIEIPERWISKFENNVSSHIHNDDLKTISTSINVSSDQNCDNNKEFQDSDSINKLNYTSQDNNDEKLIDKHRYIENGTSKESEISNQENLNKNAGSNFLFKNCFVFHKIDTVKSISFIFHVEGNGWILTHEFMTTFTNYKLYSSLMTAMRAMNIKLSLKEIDRTEYPAEFLQLDRYSLNVPRDKEKRIISINLISFQTALSVLRKLNIVSHEEVDNAFKKNEFLDSSVLPKLWSLILVYRNLRQCIEEYINNRIQVKMNL